MTWHAQCQMQKFKRGFQMELKWRRHDSIWILCHSCLSLYLGSLWDHPLVTFNMWLWFWHKNQEARIKLKLKFCLSCTIRKRTPEQTFTEIAHHSMSILPLCTKLSHTLLFKLIWWFLCYDPYLIAEIFLIRFLYWVNSLVSVQCAKYLWRSSCQRLPKLVSSFKLNIITDRNACTLCKVLNISLWYCTKSNLLLQTMINVSVEMTFNDRCLCRCL